MAISAMRRALSDMLLQQRLLSGPVSVLEQGTVMIWPSNSGCATLYATSEGLRPSRPSAHVSSDELSIMACSTGTPYLM